MGTLAPVQESSMRTWEQPRETEFRNGDRNQVPVTVSESPDPIKAEASILLDFIVTSQ